ncbi:amidohydrolase [Sulfolobales archaeon HS-7]|nr:amidohydrolase [Sulfolobales archaeon HS-7]
MLTKEELNKLQDTINSIEDEIISIRREIHKNPELSYRETKTAKLVSEYLRRLGYELRENVGGNGVVGLLKGQGEKVVALRADMDALPIQEMNNVDYRSQVKGVMHACGHDAHTAILLGVAKTLALNKEMLRGSIKLLFQPAEEAGGEGGALPMIRDGALKEPKPDYIFGLHIMAELPTGVIGYRAGPLMASPDAFLIKIKGKGGHASKPDDTIDPIFVSSQIINSIYGLRSRYVEQRKPLVISVSRIEGGTKDNIIPDEVVMEGTIRTLDETLRRKVWELMKKIIVSLCSTFGAICEVEIQEGYPVTINDPEVTENAISTLRENGFTTQEIDPIMGGEDMSRFLNEIPGMYYFLGTRNEQKGIIYPNHSSRFNVDESILKTGILSLSILALSFLR